jgi:hypothetical protein
MMTGSKYTLEKHEDMWFRDGQEYAGSGTGQVIGYRIGGLPSSEEAHIRRFPDGDSGHEWQVIRKKGGNLGEYTGHFGSPDEALTWLQNEVDNESK